MDRSYRQLPAAARQRGLPAIGFEIVTDLELAPAGHVVHCSEHRDGRVVGELTVEVFAAALIIDRDGILDAKASTATGMPSVAISLPGASGYRSESVVGGALPYHYVFAMAPHDLAVDGGILVTIRCAHPDWPAAESMLRSLRILTRHGTAPANDQAVLLPLIGK